MNYKSTRSKDTKKSTFAVLHGLATDGGLYIPESLPETTFKYEEMKNMSYQEISEKIIQLFFPELTNNDIKTAVNSAYNSTTFTNEEIVPLHKLTKNISFGELFHGRTLAFKDLALSLFPYLLLLSKEKEEEKRNILILTATSGDTGKAALEGFKNIPGINIVVFYPKNGVSPMQEEQMRKQLGNNVKISAIHGNFDDAQSAIKNVFSDNSYAEYANNKGIMFSSANSINIGRLFPQVIYYVTTYINLIKNGTITENEEFNVVVPTGNFGNILAAYVAKRLGIPIKKLISASNKNDVLSDFFKTGKYDKKRDFYTTLSPSMDILLSSNFERFLYYVLGEDDSRISSLMTSLNTTGELSISKEELETINKNFYGEFADDDLTVSAIKNVFDSYGYLMDPHTAVGFAVYDKYVAETNDTTHSVIMSTAHPFKFPEPVAKALNVDNSKDPYSILDEVSTIANISFPEKLSEVRKSEIRFSDVIEKEEIGNYIKKYIDEISQ